MTTPTEQIAHTSELIKASKLLGAQYKDSSITLPSGRVIVVEEFERHWRFWIKKNGSYFLDNNSSAKDIHDHLIGFIATYGKLKNN